MQKRGKKRTKHYFFGRLNRKKFFAIKNYYIVNNVFSRRYIHLETCFRNLHCVKGVSIRSYSGPYFPPFGLNTKRYSISLRIQPECVKIRTRITPNMDTFHAVFLFRKEKLLASNKVLCVFIICLKTLL